MSGLTRAQEIEMMRMMESFADAMKKSLNRMEESQKSIKEGLNRIEEGQKSMRESLCKKMDEIIEENRESTEKFRREREQREQASQKIDNNKPETEEIPENKNI